MELRPIWTPERLAELSRKTGQDVRVIQYRGFTADEFSIHVVTRRNGRMFRVASFAGSNYERARFAMSQHTVNTGRPAWLLRGCKAAFLPLLFDGPTY